jgi:predicted nucleic acid-binding protein
MPELSPKRDGGMLAIDTNVVVRYLVGDHPKQSAKARALIDGEDVFVSTTVMLETEWVLRSVYGLTPSDICRALRSFAGLPGVSLDDPALLATAIDRAAQGMDFADALHLGRAEGCDAFATFDRQFVKTAKAQGVRTVRTLDV